MPKINLKPNSPEYQDQQKPQSALRHCDMPYCPHEGTFRAPKDRSLSDHYWFCQDHITEYNQAWNFFDGMNQKEVEDHILKSMFGDRPTWRYDIDGMAAENLRRQAWEFHGTGYTDDRAHRAWQEYQERGNKIDSSSAEFEALAIFGLEPPVNLDTIKQRYKELAKKYHPDLNKGCAKSEELLKKVNMSYTVLKLAFQKYDQLEKA
ncbi:MAG TPA: J domain-containing protein [Alphaproteobacteria bacterium]|nr:J domain-containing protein [Alphaproteobacteria bacterium]